jgi:hypothetical protein
MVGGVATNSGEFRETQQERASDRKSEGDGALRPGRAFCEVVESSLATTPGVQGWRSRGGLISHAGSPCSGTLQTAFSCTTTNFAITTWRDAPQLRRKQRSREGISGASSAHKGLATARTTAGRPKTAPAQALANTTSVPVISDPGRKRHSQRRDTRQCQHRASHEGCPRNPTSGCPRNPRNPCPRNPSRLAGLPITHSSAWPWGQFPTMNVWVMYYLFFLMLLPTTCALRFGIMAFTRVQKQAGPNVPLVP